jgi:hypothetical protein
MCGLMIVRGRGKRDAPVNFGPMLPSAVKDARLWHQAERSRATFGFWVLRGKQKEANIAMRSKPTKSGLWLHRS